MWKPLFFENQLFESDYLPLWSQSNFLKTIVQAILFLNTVGTIKNHKYCLLITYLRSTTRRKQLDANKLGARQARRGIN